MRMFDMAQHAYENHRPPHRKNFLSYTYTLHKLLQLCGVAQRVYYDNLGKMTSRLQTQNDIWKRICGDLRWRFIEHDGPVLEL